MFRSKAKAGLIQTWALLIALGMGTMIFGRTEASDTLGPIWFGSLLLLAGLKARLILARFLNLHVASKDWKSGFDLLLVLLLLSIFSAYAAANLPVFHRAGH